MSVKTEELIQVINNFAPRNLEEDWDSSGWQINLGDSEVKRVLVALEITYDVIKEARKNGADFVLTHHPLIFGSIDMIDNNTATGNYMIKLIKAGISVYSAHTDFDNAFGGINDDLADRIGLFKVRRLHTHNYNGEQEPIMGRLGEYDSEKTLEEVCEIIKESLDIKRKLLAIGDPKAKIRKVAVCGGSGADAIPKLIGHCDLLITGDVKYHYGQMASESGLCVIEAGHYATEKYFAENMGDKLRSQIGDRVEIIESAIDVDAFKLL